MYRHIQDFINNLKEEESNTLKIFSEITDEAKKHKINEDVRSLERLAWHITTSITEIATSAGLFDINPVNGQTTPATMAGIIEIYKQANTLLAQAVRSKWTDSSLDDQVPMYGQSWAKGKVLSIILAHEAHHRSQMTVVMRMLGLHVPGIYGPAKEEWAAMGMAAQE